MIRQHANIQIGSDVKVVYKISLKEEQVCHMLT